MNIFLKCQSFQKNQSEENKEAKDTHGLFLHPRDREKAELKICLKRKQQ